MHAYTTPKFWSHTHTHRYRKKEEEEGEKNKKPKVETATTTTEDCWNENVGQREHRYRHVCTCSGLYVNGEKRMGLLCVCVRVFVYVGLVLLVLLFYCRCPHYFLSLWCKFISPSTYLRSQLCWCDVSQHWNTLSQIFATCCLFQVKLVPHVHKHTHSSTHKHLNKPKKRQDRKKYRLSKPKTEAKPKCSELKKNGRCCCWEEHTANASLCRTNDEFYSKRHSYTYTRKKDVDENKRISNLSKLRLCSVCAVLCGLRSLDFCFEMIILLFVFSFRQHRAKKRAQCLSLVLLLLSLLLFLLLLFCYSCFRKWVSHKRDTCMYIVHCAERVLIYWFCSWKICSITIINTDLIWIHNTDCRLWTEIRWQRLM